MLKFLEQNVWDSNNGEKLTRAFFADARWFEGKENIDEVLDAMKWREKHLPENKQCYKNSATFCIHCTEAHYFEGFYLYEEGLLFPELRPPIPHAWIVVDGRVLDFTHEAANAACISKEEPANLTPPLYYGVEYPDDKLQVVSDSNTPIGEYFISATDDDKKCAGHEPI